MTALLKHVLPIVLDSSTDWRLYLLQNWQSIVGSLKTRIRLEKISDDTLIIGVYESHWMQELFLLSRVLISSINKHLGQQKITRLRFKLVEEKHTRLIVCKTQDMRYEVLVPHLTCEQKHALMHIKDEQLRNELTRFLARCSST
jgi:hypothetical protein